MVNLLKDGPHSSCSAFGTHSLEVIGVNVALLHTAADLGLHIGVITVDLG